MARILGLTWCRVGAGAGAGAAPDDRRQRWSWATTVQLAVSTTVNVRRPLESAAETRTSTGFPSRVAVANGRSGPHADGGLAAAGEAVGDVTAGAVPPNPETVVDGGAAVVGADAVVVGAVVAAAPLEESRSLAAAASASLP
jgi:hypothetical protein